jgi:hypothetical protein
MSETPKVAGIEQLRFKEEDQTAVNYCSFCKRTSNSLIPFCRSCIILVFATNYPLSFPKEAFRKIAGSLTHSFYGCFNYGPPIRFFNGTKCEKFGCAKIVDALSCFAYCLDCMMECVAICADVSSENSVTNTPIADAKHARIYKTYSRTDAVVRSPAWTKSIKVLTPIFQLFLENYSRKCAMIYNRLLLTRMYARRARDRDNCYVQGKCDCNSHTFSLNFSFGSPFDIMGSLIEKACILREARLHLDIVLNYITPLGSIVLSYLA